VRDDIVDQPAQAWPATSACDGVARLAGVMAALRAPNGCPWDRDQSLATLRAYLIEESHELVDAIDALGAAGRATAAELPVAAAPAAVAALREELGDVLLQVAFQAEIARECGWFDLDAVGHAIADKMERRHPHVFGDERAALVGEVRDRWEQQKRKEGKGALAGVPRALPALLRAQRIGDKAARIGFDWPDAAAVWPKVDEEIAELREAVHSGAPAAIADEVGDALFAIANLARHLHVDAEMALRATLDKFTRRFGHVEAVALARHGVDARVALDELEALWQEAKAAERAAPESSRGADADAPLPAVSGADPPLSPCPPLARLARSASREDPERTA